MVGIIFSLESQHNCICCFRVYFITLKLILLLGSIGHLLSGHIVMSIGYI